MSSGFSSVTVKYRRCTISRYSNEIYSRRLLKLSVESFSFFLSHFTTKVLVRSEDEPGPQRLKLDFDQLGLLESEGHVGVHAGSEVLHGLGVVESLGISVRGAQLLVEPVKLFELVFRERDLRWRNSEKSGREERDRRQRGRRKKKW